MSKNNLTLRFFAVIWGLMLMLTFGLGCDDDPVDGDVDADVDGDADGDGDSDGDVDGDGDGDGDSDGDPDGDPDGDIDDDGEVEGFVPDIYCPGSEGCLDEGDGVLHVGAAMIDVTPIIDKDTEMLTKDVNGDGEYDPDDGDQFNDTNGNNAFDGVWIAGFGNGRGATGINDQQWARAIALRTNETTIVMVSIDSIGLFYDDVVRIREAAADVDVDYISVSATHGHETRDTMGNWGIQIPSTGVDLDYQDSLYDNTAEAIREAVATLRPANVEYASYFLRDQPGGMMRYIGDNRDPQIIDDEGRVMRFVEDGTESTIATILNIGLHPEYAGSHNTLLSSDVAHGIREAIEDGTVGPDGKVDGVGGIAIFFNGALGSQIGPNHINVETWDGQVLGDEESLETAMVVGDQLGYFALEALDGEGAVRDDTAALAVRAVSFPVEVENSVFSLAFFLGMFPTRETEDVGDEEFVTTEVAAIDIGRASILTAPGELDPCLFLGGYDGSYTPKGVDIVDMDATNPPDLDAAPDPPYLRDLVREDAEYVYLFGMTNDMIGYLIPEFDYELHPDNPYMDQADGDHYEETNSLGPEAWPRIRQTIADLIAWEP